MNQFLFRDGCHMTYHYATHHSKSLIIRMTVRFTELNLMTLGFRQLDLNHQFLDPCIYNIFFIKLKQKIKKFES